MKNKLQSFLAAAVLVASSAPSSALILNFDYSYDSNGFFADPTRRSVLESAGSYFETLLLDDLTAINSGGVNSFNIAFADPATGNTAQINNFSVAADTLTVFAGGRSIAGSTLGIGGPGGFSVSGTSSFVNNAVTRGETGDVQGPTATEFAPWGGSIAFNTDSTWYFDGDTSTTEPFSGNDFFSVALHELGHLLGIGTADSWDNWINGAGEFTGPASTSAYGGNVPVSSTGGHWASGVTGLVGGVSQDAAMTPSITVGTRKVFTNIDVAGLDDLGWDVSVAPVPVPAAVWLFGSGIVALLGVARRKAA